MITRGRSRRLENGSFWGSSILCPVHGDKEKYGEEIKERENKMDNAQAVACLMKHVGAETQIDAW